MSRTHARTISVLTCKWGGLVEFQCLTPEEFARVELRVGYFCQLHVLAVIINSTDTDLSPPSTSLLQRLFFFFFKVSMLRNCGLQSTAC